MTPREAYNYIIDELQGVMEDREASLTAKYLVEDLTSLPVQSEQLLSAGEEEKIKEAAVRLRKDEPWQYIGGWSDFYGLKFKVTPDVLIPRPETEELVYHTLGYARRTDASSVLDVCTGSGIIPVTLGRKHPFQRIYALDICQAALNIARWNAEYHDVMVKWMVQDILDRNKWHDIPQVDIVTANPPYITKSEMEGMHPNVVLYEPHIALFVPDDALLFYKAIAEMVLQTQGEGCFLIVEIHENYGEEVASLFVEKGFRHVSVIKDLQGKNRMVTGVK
jgi:release factor glutamine methyltransferase